jgi:serine/threonine protein kinase/Flp pilus assembly protein TadD
MVQSLDQAPGIATTVDLPRARSSDGGLATQLVAAMVAAWDRGERVTAAEMLDLCPDLDTETVLRLIFEEVHLGREAGMEVPTGEVVRRYPRWADELRDLLACDRLIRPSGAVAVLPQAGEALGPFRLLAELGRGAAGRTFLATDPGLADRPVVVKVTSGDQDEHLALAQLRHTHIVPLFSEHSFPERGLRGLCMPYLGGASLEKVLEGMAAIPLERRSGKLLVELIDRQTPPTPAPPPADGPFRRSLEQAAYAQAIAWIVACLADAVHYAQERGLVHMDIKPSNALITVDCQPMLLDFHLARGPIRPGDLVCDRFGGTPGWMSPEQLRAMEAVAACRPVPVAVDGRTDIYALGLLLRRALADTVAGPDTDPDGCDAGMPAGGLPGVSVGLGDIIRKCLAPDPSDRYEDAAALAEDLRRHVYDLPLRGVGNRSPIERWRKWQRRHPGALAWTIAGLAIAFAAAIALGVSAAVFLQRVDQVRNSLLDGRRYRAGGQYGEAIRALERGREAVRSIPAASGLTRALDHELRLATRGRMAEQLHDLADRIRFRYGIDLPTGDDARTLIKHCRAVWERRGQLIPSDVERGEGGLELERRSKTDLLELAAVWADLRVRLASPPDGDARREALRLLDEADASLGPSLAIDLRRDQLATAPGLGAAAIATTRVPHSAWEHYDLGRHHLRAGKFEAAAAEFRRAVELRPQDFWSNFYQGVCAFRLREFAEAAAAFRTCTALAPRAAICYYNRALALDAQGLLDRAYGDYTRAIELDPTLAAARLNRGILSYSRGRALEAIDDFERALAVPPADRQTLGRLHYSLALAQLSRGDRSSARSNLEAAIRHGCPETRSLRDELRAGRAVRLPSRSRPELIVRPDERWISPL